MSLHRAQDRHTARPTCARNAAVHAGLLGFALLSCGSRTALDLTAEETRGATDAARPDVALRAPDACTATCTGVVVTLATGQDMPASIAVDDTDVYWANYDDTGPMGSVVKVGIGGGSPVTLALRQGDPAWIAIDGTSVYWESVEGAVKVGLGGGAPVTLETLGGVALYGIAVTTTNVYCPAASGLLAVPIGGGTASVVAPADSVMSVTADGAFAYYTTSNLPVGSVAKVEGDGRPVTLASELAPSSIAVADGSVYWVSTGVNDGEEGAIVTVPTTGGIRVTLFTDPQIGSGTSLAVSAGTVYFTTGDGVAELGTTGVPVTLVTGQSTLSALAASATGVYWANEGDPGANDGNVAKLSPMCTCR